MCMGGGPKTPRVVTRDPKAEAEKAAQEAAKKANEEAAAVRARKSKNNLMASGAAGAVGSADTLIKAAVGKQTLGQ